MITADDVVIMMSNSGESPELRAILTYARRFSVPLIAMTARTDSTIAHEADVPIVLSYLDWGRRRGGFGPAIIPTGRYREDMDAIRDFYADKTGRHPALFAEPKLREEDDPPSSPTS